MKRRILIIDDEIGALTLIGIMLERGGFEVHKAKDGLSGLVHIPEVQPHLIITDVMMPGMKGYEVCQRIRATEAFNSIPILILSARGDADAVMHGMEAGANDYAPKPILHHDLVAKVRQMLTGYSYNWDTAPESEDQRLTRFMNPETDPYIRLSLFEWFREKMSMRDELATLWTDPSPIIRGLVAKYIGEDHSERSLQILIKLSQDVYWEVRKQTVSSLYAFYPMQPQVGNHIIESLNDDDGEVRGEIIKSLYTIPDSRVVPLLIKVLNDDPDTDVRLLAVKSLYQIKDKRATGGLIDAVKDENREIRVAVVSLLDLLKGKQILDCLEFALVDNDSEVREKAIKILLMSKKPGSKKLLANILLRDQIDLEGDVIYSFLKLQYVRQLCDEIMKLRSSDTAKLSQSSPDTRN